MKLALISAVVFLVGFVAGCGGDDETTTSTPATTETTPVTQTTAEDEDREQEDEFTIERAKPGESPYEALATDPEAALEIFFTSGDPKAACDELVTESLLSTAYGDAKGCRQAQVPAAVPDAIEIKSLDVSDEAAQATVIPDGGPNDGIETEVVLVKEGDAWLVDSLKADIPAGP